MINVRMGAVAASKASGSIPPGPYTNGTYYYVFSNRINQWYKNIANYIGPPAQPPNRYWADVLSYDLFQKPDASNQTGWKTLYTLLEKSYNPNNDTTIYHVPYTGGSKKWLTTVNVTVTNGYASFSFPDGGTSSYYNTPRARGGAGFYTASLINGGWIP